MDSRIAGDTALVTASSSGLGRGSAAALVDRGANVVINGRDEDRLAAAVADLRDRIEAADDDTPAADATVVGQPADLTDPGAAETLVGRTVDGFGGLDHLVTSAGGPPSGPFLDTTDDDWQAAFDLLVMSVVRLVREAAPHLRESGRANGPACGTVVTITSKSVKEAIDKLVLSNAVRMGVIGLEKTLARELAPEVRANAVLPGAHETARIRELIEQGVDCGEYDDYEDGRDDRATGIPLERMGDPEELGEVVAFLSSPRSGYVNGAAIPVDGGATRSNL
jgi:NAD(P)-dependent dehydrogenase (short-subunit alcohol dehydrogenase family)